MGMIEFSGITRELWRLGHQSSSAGLFKRLIRRYKKWRCNVRVVRWIWSKRCRK